MEHAGRAGRAGRVGRVGAGRAVTPILSFEQTGRALLLYID